MLANAANTSMSNAMPYDILHLALTGSGYFDPIKAAYQPPSINSLNYVKIRKVHGVMVSTMHLAKRYYFTTYSVLYDV